MELNLKIHVFILVWWDRTISELYNLNPSQVSLSLARRWERVVVPIELIFISRRSSKQAYFLFFCFVSDRTGADSAAYHNNNNNNIQLHLQNLLKRSLFSRLTKIYTHIALLKGIKNHSSTKQNKQHALLKDFSVYNNRE